jgi:hypothetical protein
MTSQQGQFNTEIIPMTSLVRNKNHFEICIHEEYLSLLLILFTSKIIYLFMVFKLHTLRE